MSLHGTFELYSRTYHRFTSWLLLVAGLDLEIGVEFGATFWLVTGELAGARYLAGDGCASRCQVSGWWLVLAGARYLAVGEAEEGVLAVSGRGVGAAAGRAARLEAEHEGQLAGDHWLRDRRVERAGEEVEQVLVVGELDGGGG